MSSTSDDSQRALGAAALAVFAWGFGPLLLRGVHGSAGTIVFWRFALAQPVMIGASYYFGGGLTWRLVKKMLLPGVLFAVSMFAGFTSFQKTSIVNASLIQALQPALLLCVAPWVFGTRTSRRQLAFGSITLAGVASLVVGGGATAGSAFSGDLWAVFSLVLWTCYFILVQRARNDGEDATSILAAVFVVSFIVAAPWTLTTSHDVLSIGWRGFLLVVCMVLGPGLIGHGLMMWAQRHLDIRISSLMGLASPVVSTLGAWIVYSQRLEWLQIAGGVVVLAGLAGIAGDHRSKRSIVPLSSAISADDGGLSEVESPLLS